MRVLRWIAALVVGLAPLAAGAQEPRKFGVLSIIGDRMLIVSHHGETGTRVDFGRRDYVDMPPRVLDNAVLAGLERQIRSSAAGSEVVMLGANASLYAAQGTPVEDPDVKPVVDLVREPLQEAGVTHLVLVSKLRHDARLRFADGYIGTGKLEGLGFYMDHVLRTRNSEGTVHGRGFLAPFAYFRVSLVDVTQGGVLAQRDVVASVAVSAGRSPSLQVWEALSSEEKVKLVNGLTRREAAAAVREMLEAR